MVWYDMVWIISEICAFPCPVVRDSWVSKCSRAGGKFYRSGSADWFLRKLVLRRAFERAVLKASGGLDFLVLPKRTGRGAEEGETRSVAERARGMVVSPGATVSKTNKT